MKSLSQDLEFRGLIYQVSDPGVLAKLDAGGVTAYTGFDPTASSLHVGHLLPILNLRRLQEAGNSPIVVAGGATGIIGDPSFRSDERKLLSQEELDENLAGVSAQLGSLLDFSASAGKSKALLLDNSTWLGTVSLIDFLRDVGKYFSVNQMIAKDSVKSRLEERESGISFTEFSYMLLQAYDFLHLFDSHDCRLQMGASDQWGNITVGIDLIRRMRGEESWGFTNPLLLGPDGNKFGKTGLGTVWLDAQRTSPYALYQFFLNADDSLVGTYLRYLTFLDHDAISDLDSATADKPEARDAQRALARSVTTTVHGEAAAISAESAAAALFSEDIVSLRESEILDVLRDAPSSSFSRGRLDDGVSFVDALVESGLESSKGAARRTLTQGGAYVNNRRVDDPEGALSSGDLIDGRYVILRKGKKSQHLLRFE